MLVIDPFGVLRRGRGFFMKKLVGLWKLISGFFSPLITGWLNDQHLIWKLLVRFGWGMFWSFYVCIILFALVLFSMVARGYLIRNLVENPVEMKGELNFDYTQNSPVAFVPIMSCGGVGCGLTCEEKSLGPRVIPPNHELEVNVLLTLPESGYNRILRFFSEPGPFGFCTNSAGFWVSPKEPLAFWKCSSDFSR
ncbi:seipin-2-like [Manihot esculenta]|uniref:Uncharacterized protein n=1 Tax=Manihot esculenta TaxID=3983 RepID=A0ACB7HME3_MANES|nr:seipin-2-like [Manihot esculenta]KAG8653326.1 hypothetical protein MANES_05G011866v8 [Manihot esculenta]